VSGDFLILMRAFIANMIPHDSNFPESAKCGVASSQFEWVPLSLELRRVLHTINSKEMESLLFQSFFSMFLCLGPAK
jgi:hypothetical protein